ncbi:hypothetical protein AMATHDRAFT_3379 [Amanita thiersii Skay4041]|uniref:Uncharacterized protein n=1 Tax=Amanita thiersii Skay4041 TaxID=703135 RepID=A0A2A9NJF1_9AGAR|nr:hypothetical protein AMATHDRAFT_3379 [Amanita thiersii Skay4041]
MAATANTCSLATPRKPAVSFGSDVFIPDINTQGKPSPFDNMLIPSCQELIRRVKVVERLGVFRKKKPPPPFLFKWCVYRAQRKSLRQYLGYNHQKENSSVRKSTMWETLCLPIPLTSHETVPHTPSPSSYASSSSSFSDNGHTARGCTQTGAQTQIHDYASSDSGTQVLPPRLAYHSRPKSQLSPQAPVANQATTDAPSTSPSNVPAIPGITK